MDSVKIKMQNLVTERGIAISRAEEFEEEKARFEENCKELEKKITLRAKEISVAEENLDDTLADLKHNDEKQQSVILTCNEAEQADAGLVRRLQLLKSELDKVNERLSECNRQLARQEADFGDSERARKAGENKVLNLDEKIALCEAQLEEAIYREKVKKKPMVCVYFFILENLL